ncbi:hypothetical protein [Kineosporia sp. R_H_3]|uniref:hypothetical protein n=1 Tax=Kineosporia sp. R_H_3 TaxID=1961848 RepID=UPI000B4B7F62|nr:hypothetical protein [Kineosporia sp. R_H_3]
MVGRDRRSAARAAPGSTPAWQELASWQAGAVSRRQLLASGLTAGQVGALLDARRWTGLHPGVYATFTGPVPPMTRVWAAVLAAGDGAALGGTTALWLWQVLPVCPGRLTLCVPERRRVVAPAGSYLVRRRHLADRVHPAGAPPRLRLEEAVLDVTDEAADLGTVVEVVLRATASRRTTPARLRLALRGRKQHRRRRLLEEILGEAADGVQSALERRYRRDVERRHALPHGERNRAEPVHDAAGRLLRHRYRDVRYRRWSLVVELDGLEAHPRWLRHRDRRRDNSVTLADDKWLQYGWLETVSTPCIVAAEVVTVLRSQGWCGSPVRCGPGCDVASD